MSDTDNRKDITISNVPEDLLREMKIACLRNDTTLAEVVRQLMQQYIDNQQQNSQIHT